MHPTPLRVSAIKHLFRKFRGGSGWRKFGLVFICNCFLVMAASTAANSQSVTGQIAGTVTDTTGGAIVGATVKLTHDLSQQTRTFTTGNGGSFTFPDLVPGNYSVRIEAPGFKMFGLKAISVSAQERVDLHEIKLDAGNVNEEVT